MPGGEPPWGHWLAVVTLALSLFTTVLSLAALCCYRKTVPVYRTKGPWLMVVQTLVVPMLIGIPFGDLTKKCTWRVVAGWFAAQMVFSPLLVLLFRIHALAILEEGKVAVAPLNSPKERMEEFVQRKSSSRALQRVSWLYLGLTGLVPVTSIVAETARGVTLDCLYLHAFTSSLNLVPYALALVTLMAVMLGIIALCIKHPTTRLNLWDVGAQIMLVMTLAMISLGVTYVPKGGNVVGPYFLNAMGIAWQLLFVLLPAVMYKRTRRAQVHAQQNAAASTIPGHKTKAATSNPNHNHNHNDNRHTRCRCNFWPCNSERRRRKSPTLSIRMAAIVSAIRIRRSRIRPSGMGGGGAASPMDDPSMHSRDLMSPTSRSYSPRFRKNKKHPMKYSARNVDSATFMRMMDTPAGYERVLRECQLRFCAENALFYAAVRAYQKRPSLELLHHILNQFLELSSPLEINIPSRERARIIQDVREHSARVLEMVYQAGASSTSTSSSSSSSSSSASASAPAATAAPTAQLTPLGPPRDLFNREMALVVALIKTNLPPDFYFEDPLDARSPRSRGSTRLSDRIRRRWNQRKQPKPHGDEEDDDDDTDGPSRWGLESKASKHSKHHQPGRVIELTALPSPSGRHEGMGLGPPCGPVGLPPLQSPTHHHGSAMMSRGSFEVNEVGGKDEGGGSVRGGHSNRFRATVDMMRGPSEGQSSHNDLAVPGWRVHPPEVIEMLRGASPHIPSVGVRDPLSTWPNPNGSPERVANERRSSRSPSASGSLRAAGHTTQLGGNMALSPAVENSAHHSYKLAWNIKPRKEKNRGGGGGGVGKEGEQDSNNSKDESSRSQNRTTVSPGGRRGGGGGGGGPYDEEPSSPFQRKGSKEVLSRGELSAMRGMNYGNGSGSGSSIEPIGGAGGGGGKSSIFERKDGGGGGGGGGRGGSIELGLPPLVISISRVDLTVEEEHTGMVEDSTNTSTNHFQNPRGSHVSNNNTATNIAISQHDGDHDPLKTGNCSPNESPPLSPNASPDASPNLGTPNCGSLTHSPTLSPTKPDRSLNPNRPGSLGVVPQPTHHSQQDSLNPEEGGLDTTALSEESHGAAVKDLRVLVDVGVASMAAAMSPFHFPSPPGSDRSSGARTSIAAATATVTTQPSDSTQQEVSSSLRTSSPKVRKICPVLPRAASSENHPSSSYTRSTSTSMLSPHSLSVPSPRPIPGISLRTSSLSPTHSNHISPASSSTSLPNIPSPTSGSAPPPISRSSSPPSQPYTPQGSSSQTSSPQPSPPGRGGPPGPSQPQVSSGQSWWSIVQRKPPGTRPQRYTSQQQQQQHQQPQHGQPGPHPQQALRPSPVRPPPTTRASSLPQSLSSRSQSTAPSGSIHSSSPSVNTNPMVATSPSAPFTSPTFTSFSPSVAPAGGNLSQLALSSSLVSHHSSQSLSESLPSAPLSSPSSQPEIRSSPAIFPSTSGHSVVPTTIFSSPMARPKPGGASGARPTSPQTSPGASGATSTPLRILVRRRISPSTPSGWPGGAIPAITSSSSSSNSSNLSSSSGGDNGGGGGGTMKMSRTNSSGITVSRTNSGNVLNSSAASPSATSGVEEGGGGGGLKSGPFDMSFTASVNHNNNNNNSYSYNNNYSNSNSYNNSTEGPGPSKSSNNNNNSSNNNSSNNNRSTLSGNATRVTSSSSSNSNSANNSSGLRSINSSSRNSSSIINNNSNRSIITSEPSSKERTGSEGGIRSLSPDQGEGIGVGVGVGVGVLAPTTDVSNKRTDSWPLPHTSHEHEQSISVINIIRNNSGTSSTTSTTSSSTTFTNRSSTRTVKVHHARSKGKDVGGGGGGASEGHEEKGTITTTPVRGNSQQPLRPPPSLHL